MATPSFRAVGPEHCTLSSDAGEPLFPNSVECMRLMRGFMGAFGLTEDELELTTQVNPAKVMGGASTTAGRSAVTAGGE